MFFSLLNKNNAIYLFLEFWVNRNNPLATVNSSLDPTSANICPNLSMLSLKIKNRYEIKVLKG